MLPKYHDILRHEAGLDILIFSGDVDGIVPVIGTRRWLASLQLPILKEWRPWYSLTGVASFTNYSLINTDLFFDSADCSVSAAVAASTVKVICRLAAVFALSAELAILFAVV